VTLSTYRRYTNNFIYLSIYLSTDHDDHFRDVIWTWIVGWLQVDFLNSVIVDLQRKNEALQLQLEAAVSLQNTDSDVELKYVHSLSIELDEISAVT